MTIFNHVSIAALLCNKSSKYLRKENYIFTDTEKKLYQKAVKYGKKVQQFWSAPQTLLLPLNIPTLSDNRWTDVAKVAQNLKEGYNPALKRTPKVVAIPAELMFDAIQQDPTFIDDWDIRVEGFHELTVTTNEHSVKQWFYLQVVDGRHRQVIEAAIQGHSVFDSFSDLKGTWECKVVFATPPKTVEDVTQAFKEAHKLYIELNVKKIRKPSASDNFGAEVKSGDPEANRHVAMMEQIGVWVDGGKTGYGDTNGVKTKYALLKRDALKNPKLNVNLLKQATDWIKTLDTDFDSNVEYSSTLIAALALVQVVWPMCKNGNGAQKVWEGWLSSKLSEASSSDLVSDWKILGGNQDNKYAESVALGMLEDFKSKKLKKNIKLNKKDKTVYNQLVIDDVRLKLFPPPKLTTSNIAVDEIEEQAEQIEQNQESEVC